MTDQMRDAICATVRDAHGVKAAIAVFAAIEVAKKEWKDEYTKSYGTISEEFLLKAS